MPRSKTLLVCVGEGFLGALGLKNRRRSLSLGFASRSCLVASASADCTVRFWSMWNWACVRIFNLAKVNRSFHAEGNVFSPLLRRTRSTALQRVTPLSMAITNKRLYVGTSGSDVLIWNIETMVHSLAESMYSIVFDERFGRQVWRRVRRAKI